MSFLNAYDWKILYVITNENIYLILVLSQYSNSFWKSFLFTFHNAKVAMFAIGLEKWPAALPWNAVCELE